jgi:hypothetical protein
MQMQKRLLIGLPDELRAKLDAATAKTGASLNSEIRARLEQTFRNEQFDPHTRLLMALVGYLAELAKLDTNGEWHAHAAANKVFRQGVASLLSHFGQPSGDPVFAADELPAARLVESDDPTTIGIGLAAIAFHNRPLTDDERRQIAERTKEHQRLREQSAQGRGPVSSLFVDKPKGGKS